MAETLKNLGQVATVANTLTPLYTVPGAKSAVISSLSVCNRSDSQPMRFRLAHAIAGAADDSKQYVFYDELVPPNKTFIATIGITMATTDVLRVYASHNEASFSAWGSEVS